MRSGFIAGLLIGLLIGAILGPLVRAWILWHDVESTRREAGQADELLDLLERSITASEGDDGIPGRPA
ncbi:MAG: hypothetical protein ACRDJM_07105 [Actinomycetota bacterium]